MSTHQPPPPIRFSDNDTFHLTTPSSRRDDAPVWRVDGLELKIEDPEMTVLLIERDLLADYSGRLEGYREVLRTANPDLSIGMWERFRSFVQTVNRSRFEDHALLQCHRKKRCRKGASLNSDPSPLELANNLAALSALGRWRAAVQLQMIWMYAQLHVVKPTAVLRHSRQALVTLASDLDGVIQNRAKIAIDQWREDSEEDIAVDAVFVKAKGSQTVIRAVIRRPVA